MLKAVPTNAVFADIWRCAALYKHGGLYIDVDIEIKKPISEWPGYPWENIQILISPEPLYNNDKDY